MARRERVRLMGEDLIVFRDSRGQVGLLEELCPHRGASLLLARNEECGLRCLYHGWKFDVNGKVLDMPAEPDANGMMERVRRHVVSGPRSRAESSGPIWARQARSRRRSISNLRNTLPRTSST